MNCMPTLVPLINALVIVIPEGDGEPRAVGGGIWDFVGILQHICAPRVGEMKGL